MNQIILFFIVALGEWLIGILATRTIAKGKLIPSVVLIFVEQLAGFWVFWSFVQALDQWHLAISYSLGASLGTGISLWLTRNMKEVSNEETNTLRDSGSESGSQGGWRLLGR